MEFRTLNAHISIYIPTWVHLLVSLSCDWGCQFSHIFLWVGLLACMMLHVNNMHVMRISTWAWYWKEFFLAFLCHAASLCAVTVYLVTDFLYCQHVSISAALSLMPSTVHSSSMLMCASEPISIKVANFTAKKRKGQMRSSEVIIYIYCIYDDIKFFFLKWPWQMLLNEMYFLLYHTVVWAVIWSMRLCMSIAIDRQTILYNRVISR